MFPGKGLALVDEWRELTDSGCPGFVTPAKYTQKHIFTNEYRLSNRHMGAKKLAELNGRKDAEVGIEVLTTSYVKELAMDLAILKQLEQKASSEDCGPIDKKEIEKEANEIFMKHAFKRHMKFAKSGAMTLKEYLPILEVQFNEMNGVVMKQDNVRMASRKSRHDLTEIHRLRKDLKGIDDADDDGDSNTVSDTDACVLMLKLTTSC